VAPARSIGRDPRPHHPHHRSATDAGAKVAWASARRAGTEGEPERKASRRRQPPGQIGRNYHAARTRRLTPPARLLCLRVAFTWSAPRRRLVRRRPPLLGRRNARRGERWRRRAERGHERGRAPHRPSRRTSAASAG
jgi:hypothetical protein